MVAIPLASKSDPAKREVVSPERLVNLYAVAASEEARSRFYLNRTPGMTAFSLVSSELCRGLFNADSEGLGVYGSTLFSINEDGGAILVSGTIAGTRDIRFAQNNATNRETTLATGTTFYQYTNGALSIITGDLSGINIVDAICINGIHIAFTAAGRAYYSAVNDANNYSALNFFDVPGTGSFVAARLIGNQFAVWREYGMYIYRHDADDADEPFKLVNGADKPFGCLNTFANADVGGVVCFVDQYGMPRIVGQGYLPQPIGNDGVQSDIAEMVDSSELRLWGYVTGSSQFLVVRSSEFCWVYDFREQRWHERQSYQRVTWQAKHHMRFAGKDLVAPDQSGDLFFLDNTSFSEDGEHIVWEATCPLVTNFPNGGTIHALHFDIEVGTALGADAESEDREPQFMVFISRDAGKTYGIGRQLSLGTRGKWRKRLTLNRCGDFGREGFVIRLSGAGKTPNAIMNLDAEISKRAA